MSSQRLLRAGTPTEVSVLAVMALVLSVGNFSLAAFPLAKHSPVTVMLTLGVVGLVIAAALVLAGPHISAIHLHVTIVLFTLLIAVMVADAVTERGMMISALGYIWTAFYVAFFFRPVQARAYAALMTVALGVALLRTHAATDVSVWVILSGMTWVAVAILSRLNERLRTEAHTDNLTGVLNRTGFVHAAVRQRAMARRRGESIALAVIDLDDFKGVNDRAGHAAGDRLLIELATMWTASLRPGDLLGRFGGDEFVLMLSNATEDQLHDLLARLARAHPASWTAGAVRFEEHESLDEAIGRADARLYAAKGARQGAVGRPWIPLASPAAT